MRLLGLCVLVFLVGGGGGVMWHRFHADLEIGWRPKWWRDWMESLWQRHQNRHGGWT